MPSTVNAAGRRKVRCPKCTALLTEPQTQIYECPICLTLLLAKGNSGRKSSGNRVLRSSDDIQQIIEGGSKLEKATLVNASSNEFEGRSRTPQEGHVPSDLDNQPLSGISFSKLKTEPVDDLAPKNNALAPDTPPDTPHRRKSLHDGEISPRGGSGHRSSELDSASHSESEGDLDSPIWSSENANIGEVPEVSSLESSSLVDGSSEHFSTSSGAVGNDGAQSLSSGPVGNDGAQTLQEGSKFETRKPSDAMASDRGAEEETEHEERHQNLSSYEIAHEEGATVEERPYLDSRIRNSDVPVVTSSGKSSLEEGQEAKDKNYGEVANDKDVDSSHNSSSDWLAGSTGSKSPQNNPVDSTPKERVSGDSNQHKEVEIPKVGKFGLFDLSVFGIYNEDTYSELRRGKAAHYSKLSESGSDGEGVRSTVDGDLVSQVAAQGSSREQDRAENSVAENIVQKSLNVSESVTDGTHIEAGSYGEMHLDREQDTDARSSGSVGQKVDDGGNLKDVGLLPNSSVDSDVLANARYGDDLAIRDLSLEMVSSVDISFGDWRVQQVVKPPQKSLQTYVDEDSLYERRMLDLASGEDTDSSWDDDEELTFSSASKEDSKLQGTSWTDKGAQAPPLRRKSIGRSQAKPLLENPALPIRTTAMQKFLQRNEQESTVQTHAQESIKADSTLYEAPYMEHYTPSLEKDVHESAYQTTALTPESNAYDTPYVKEDTPQMIAVPEKLEDKESEITECLDEDKLLHSTLVSNVGNEAVSPTPLSWKEEDVQTVRTEGAQSRKELAIGNDAVSLSPSGLKEKDVQTVIMEVAQSRKEFDAVRNPQRDVPTVILEDAQSRKELDAVRNSERDVRLDKAGMETMDHDSQNVGYFKNRHINKVGSAPGKPVSLRWKGKGSSTQSLSSTEDDGAYGMESEAGSGPDKDTAKKPGVGPIEGHTFSDKEAHLRLGQQTRGHYQPTQRTWLSNIDVDRQKHGSGELVTSRRSARSRAANARLSSQESFEQVDAPRMEGRISNLDTFGRSGLDRPDHVPTRESQALNLNRSMLDQGLNYSYNGTADYNSDHSSRSQDVPSRTQYNETYLSNSYGLPAAGNTQAHPFQVPLRGSVPRASLQEPGFTHSAHHCASPTCSVCMQQQYYMQPPQMLQNVMLQPCAACASQSSAAAYHQPMHHGMHSHHVHGSTYSNPSLRQYDSGVLPVQSQRQNRSSIHQSHPLPLARRPKLYPPLPGKDAPPYVLCKHCNQLLQVPEYLPPISGPILKLQCGSCEKISKFSVPLQAASPSANKTLWATSGGLAMNASDSNNVRARDKRHTDTTNIHSSDRIPSSGLAPSAQNLYGMARHTSGHGSQQGWVEDRMFSQSSASGISQTESVISRHQARPMASVPEQYRSYGRHGEGEHLHNNTGIYSEGYLSSSPSSPSGSSPGRPSQISRQHQQVEPLRQRRPGFGDRTLSPDLPAPSTTMHEQGGPPFEAPGISDGFFQKGLIENRSRFSSTSLQGSLHDPYSDSPGNEHLDRLQQASKAGSWHNQPADADYSGRSALRSRMEQVRNLPAAPGSPLIEHFTQDADDFGPTLPQRHMLQNSGNGPWSPGSESRLVDSFTQDSLTDFSARYHERERLPLPVQDASKGPKSFVGLFKRSVKDQGKGGQGGNNRRKVIVNGHLISEAAVRKAEEQAGPIHSGSYWYDYQAGFWGVMGGPCLGILMPFIEEFHYPLARDCAGGRTEILVNGRELHVKDLEVLAKRGLPTNSGKAYILDISGALFDDVTSQPLRGLGKLAPSIEKKGRGFGMSPFTAQP